MSAGQLRHLVELQSKVDTVDEIGQPSTSWLTVAYPHAGITYQNATASLKAGVDVSISRAIVKMRHRAVNAGQRVLHEGVAFNIESVQPDIRRAYVYLTCEVINAAIA
jgi:SPP1 family predicted phage head-tail adaptor